MSYRYEYITPTTDGKMSWRSVSSCTSDSGEALENWKNRMHQVSMRRCVRITRFVRRLGAKERKLPTHEFFPNLAYFLAEFEEKVIESQRLPSEFALKAIPISWWGTHK